MSWEKKTCLSIDSAEVQWTFPCTTFCVCMHVQTCLKTNIKLLVHPDLQPVPPPGSV